MNTGKKKGLIAGTVVFLLFAGIMLFIVIFNPSHTQKFDESNTVEHEATLVEVSETDGVYEIIIEEFPAALGISKNALANEEELLSLQPGARITFRVPDFYDDALNTKGIKAVIVSLSCDGADILTFDSYNTLIRNTMKNLIVTGSILFALFFGSGVTCLVFLIKEIKWDARHKKRTGEI